MRDRAAGAAALARPESAPASVLVALTVLAAQLYLAIGRNFANVLETPFLPYCLLGAFSIHLATRPGLSERLWTLALGSLSAVAFVAWSGRFQPTWSGMIACGAFFGLSSLTVLAVQVLRLRGSLQTEKLNTLLAGSAFGYSAIVIAAVLNLTTRIQPRTYDLYLYAADLGYGVPFCAWTGQFLAAKPWLLQACSLVYESLPLAVSLLYAYQRSGAKRLSIRVLPAFIGGGAAVYLLYNLLPACGPYYAFGKAFPNHLPPLVGLHLITLGAGARNAIPSMHLACVLLIFWNARPFPIVIRAAAALYLVLTMLACVGFGEHYMVDLVAAVPYALVLQSFCAPPGLRSRPEWKHSLVTGLLLSFAWILLVRFGAPLFGSTVFAWALSLATLSICGAARRQMIAAESRRPAAAGIAA